MWRLVIILAAALTSACEWDYERMIDQPNARAYEPNPFLPNNATLQPVPRGTVSRDAVIGPPALLMGIADGSYVEDVPIEVTQEVLERGRNRFEIFCATCHGLIGDGESEVAENMTLVPPPSLHLQRLRTMPVGRLFAVASFGYGLMPGYRERIELADRWAVVAYVQVLQLSQYAVLDELPSQVSQEANQWLK